MRHIDRQRISAVRPLESKGYVFHGNWIAPAEAPALATATADAMHALLAQRADRLLQPVHAPDTTREYQILAWIASVATLATLGVAVALVVTTPTNLLEVAQAWLVR